MACLAIGGLCAKQSLVAARCSSLSRRRERERMAFATGPRRNERVRDYESRRARRRSGVSAMTRDGLGRSRAAGERALEREVLCIRAVEEGARLCVCATRSPTVSACAGGGYILRSCLWWILRREVPQHSIHHVVKLSRAQVSAVKNQEPRHIGTLLAPMPNRLALALLLHLPALVALNIAVVGGTGFVDRAFAPARREGATATSSQRLAHDMGIESGVGKPGHLGGSRPAGRRGGD